MSSYDIPLERPDAIWTRHRSNSSDQQIQGSALANISSPHSSSGLPLSSSDQIDGIQHSPTKASLLPVLNLSADPLGFDLPTPAGAADDSTTPASEKRMSFPYANPAHNSSAPALSQFNNAAGGGMTNRSVTAPLEKKKELVWAPNCAVYHTFHGSEYDRRSEPATCNRLTPQLAQEIKAFLNQYKLEEMEVHPSSRANTQFFG